MHGEVVIPKKIELKNLYIKDKLSTYKIADIFNCDHKTIYRYIRLYGIKTRPLKRVAIEKEDLYNDYFNKKLSLEKISKKYNCCAVTVLDKMKKFSLKRRTISETSTKYPKKDFDGNDNLKAYMVGFRTGDLRVRKVNNLLDIGCGTTKDAQIELIKSIFENYGPVFLTKKDKRGAMHVDCSLNQTFSFLLPKHNKIPSWILNKKSSFLNFLAGYTDAEGNICISNGRAKFRIRTYDRKILWQINKKLISFSIGSLFKLDRKAGMRKNGVLQNKDCWGITVNDRLSLYKILSLLKPLLKHGKRINDLKAALINVKKRLKIK